MRHRQRATAASAITRPPEPSAAMATALLVRLVVSVLPETVLIGGVSTRVVEERETRYYFGEDVDSYKKEPRLRSACELHGHDGDAIALFRIAALPLFRWRD